MRNLAIFEMERRGYLTSGEFVPEVALEYPEVLENLHKEFQHAGSNIVQAFTYNGHREKMRVINKEHLLEPLNRAALKIARKCADNPPKGLGVSLMAGNISNSTLSINEKALFLIKSAAHAVGLTVANKEASPKIPLFSSKFTSK